MSSDISGLYKLGMNERRKRIAEALGLDQKEMEGLYAQGVDDDILDGMIENVIGRFVLPVGIATNFKVNGRDHLVPMAVEEASVVAAASKAAGIARKTGGFNAEVSGSVMIGQVQLVDIDDAPAGARKVISKADDVLEKANSVDPVLVKFGGGAKGLEVRIVGTPSGPDIVVHLLVDCRDAMGANAVNTMAEAIAPLLEEITGGRSVLRIISNLAVKRITTARACFPLEDLGGEEGARSIINAFELAMVDPFRAATHNKGIMNGVSAVVRSTGNDTRAVEAGAHAFAALGGSYSPLTRYHLDGKGHLVGEISIPTAVGTVGGATKVHPSARAALKILGTGSAEELSEVIASVGLAQNLGALRALALEGIQRGHMKLHARNLAIQEGAGKDEVEEVVSQLISSGTVTASRALEILKGIRSG